MDSIVYVISASLTIPLTCLSLAIIPPDSFNSILSTVLLFEFILQANPSPPPKEIPDKSILVPPLLQFTS